MTNNNQSAVLSVVKFLKFVFKKCFIVIITLLLCAGVGFSYCYFKVDPTYTSTKSLILKMSIVAESGSVNEKYQNIANEATLAKMYFPTISTQITSPKCKENAIKILGEGKNSMTNGSVAVSYTEESLIFKVSYSATLNESVENPYEYTDARLNAIIEGAREIVKEKDFVMAENVDFIAVQNDYSHSVSSNKVKIMIISGFAGIILGLGILFIVFISNNTIKEAEELEKMTGVSVLAYTGQNTKLQKKTKRQDEDIE